MKAINALALILLSTAASAPAQRGAQSVDLQQGLMAGEVGPTSAILQSRLTSARDQVNPAWEGIPGVDGTAYFEYADNAAFTDSRRSAELVASPRGDFIVKTKIDGLEPDRRYFYRLHYGRSTDNLQGSESASFRTLAGSARPAAFSLAVVTGMNYSHFHFNGNGRVGPYSGPDKDLGYPALESILELRPDFFVGTGDNVYYDHPGPRGRAQTQHEMRKKFHEQFSQPRFLDLFASVATYWMKDDHDHRFDDSDAINPVRIRFRKETPYYPKTNVWEGESGSGFAPSHELGIRIFREQMPLVDPTDPDAVTYRTHRISRDLQIWLVEGRDYRSPNDMPDGPDKTIWGDQQKGWLKRTLAASDATFKILLSPTPLIGPDSASKRDNHADIDGARHERDEFFAWLAENRISTERFFIVCGDRHWQYHAVDSSGFQEFSSGALVDENAIPGVWPGDANSTDPEGKIKHLHHNREATGGFLIVRVQPQGDGAVASFTFHDENGERLYRERKTVAARDR